MNIFKRRDEALSDDLPGFRERPRPTLPPVEEEVGEAVREQFVKRQPVPTPKTPAGLAEELTSHATDFERAVADAESAAKAYCATYDELYQLVHTKLESIEAQRTELQRLRATLPRIGGTDEETSSDRNSSPDNNPSAGQGVPDKSIKSLVKPLSFDRR